MSPVRLTRHFAWVLALLSSAQVLADPEWLGGPPKNFPLSQYLLGRGSGGTVEDAQNRARGDLATVFEVRVEVVTESSTTVSKTGGKEQVDRRDGQRVQASTDKVINGINIAEVWRDPKTSNYHALAVLSRSQAAAGLRDEIAQIDTAAQNEFTGAARENDPLVRLGGLSRAFDKAVSRDGFQASLKVVDPSGVGIPPPLTQGQIRQEMDRTLKRISIAPVVADDGGAKEFGGALKAGLAAAGFLARDPASAELKLLGRLELTDIGRRNNWNWVRGTVEVSLVDRDKDRVRGGKSWPIKASALDAKTARMRAIQEVEKLLKEELRSAIIGFAAS